MDYSIKEVLMTRDGLSEAEAEDLIEEAREELTEWVVSERLAVGEVEELGDICRIWFGLEPDYLDDLLWS